jgi:hypothetical protein
MDVVDRYLLNVRAYLPAAAREDYVAELRENIRAQVEDREERLGRPLGEDERIAILRAHGRPLLVAGAYRSDGRRLVLGREVIGPELFPFYRLALLGVAAITELVVGFASAAASIDDRPPFPVFRTAFFQLALLATIATVVFGLLDAHFRRTAQTWDPRALPASERKPVTPGARRVGAGVQIAFTLAFLWFWVAFNSSPYVQRFGIHGVQLGPAWRLLYVGLTVSTVISLATPMMTLVRPDWHRLRWLVSLFSSGAFIAFTMASMWTGDWVVPAAALDALRVEALCDGINQGFKFGLGITVLVVALNTVSEVVRGAWREYRRAAPA